MEKIDFVVPWVDSSDEEWIRLYNKYRGIQVVSDDARFRNWGIFKYWFRAVEKNAPWVNKIFLITNGTFPKFINPNHPKLVLVRHEDYIPKRFLPTFNSATIELNINRISELSEHFVYFNDDFFLNAPVTPDYFFKNGLPCDNNREKVFSSIKWSETDNFGISLSECIGIGIINCFFNRKSVVMDSLHKWFGLHLGLRGIISSLLLYRKQRFQGFVPRHTEQAHLKSVINEVWDNVGDKLEESCTQFREENNVIQCLFRYWQFATNRFYPTDHFSEKAYMLGRDNISDIIETLSGDNIKSICINDTPYCDKNRFDQESKILKQAFESKYPDKSSFEL